MSTKPSGEKAPAQKTKKKQSWPFITSRTYPNGTTGWTVDARTKAGGSRRTFPTKAEAETFALKERAKRTNSGNAAFDETELAKFKWTVPMAIEFALRHLRQTAESKTLSEAVESLLKSKRGKVGALRYLDIERRLNKFANANPGKTMAEITMDDIKTFLDQFTHPVTRNDYRKEIVMLWAYAKGRDRQWVQTAIDKSEVPREDEPENARAILTVDEAERLMKACIHPDIILNKNKESKRHPAKPHPSGREYHDITALNALVLFGGVRVDEVKKLDWRDINFRAKHIEISSKNSKVHAERFAPMTDNLIAWLKPIAQKSGPIIIERATLARRLRKLWKKAGFAKWVPDSHRHSFISYRRQIIGDAQTALDAGTSERIIKRHYKRPVTKDDAVKFFEILPPISECKIIPMEGAA